MKAYQTTEERFEFLRGKLEWARMELRNYRDDLKAAQSGPDSGERSNAIRIAECAIGHLCRWRNHWLEELGPLVEANPGM